MTAPTTCTIGPSAVTGERCGKPAVATFTGPDGVIYAECIDHVHDFTLFGDITFQGTFEV